MKLFTQRRRSRFEIQDEAVMSNKERLAFFVLVTAAVFFLIRYVVWWFNPVHLPDNWSDEIWYLNLFDFVIFYLLSFVIFLGLFLRLGTWFTLWHISKPKPVALHRDYRVAFLTCYVPGKEPLSMLEETLTAMTEVDYPHDTWVLDEGGSKEVQELAKKLNVKYFSRHAIKKFNRLLGKYKAKTKAGNLNSWRKEHEKDYDIVAQVDMDHKPKKNFLTKVLGYFRDRKVGFVGVPQIYKNTSNWIAKGAAEQTHFFYGPMQQGFYGAKMPFFIGTTHIYRTSAMRSIKGYAPTIAEDHLTGMHFFSKKWKGVYLPEVIAEGDGPSNWTDYFNQQMRWSYGLFEILFKHTPKHFLKLDLKQKINLFFAQLFYFSGVAMFIGFLLTSLYLLLGINPTNMFFEEWILYSLPSFLTGQAIVIFMHRYYIDPKNEPSIGLLGMFLGQAANIIYANAFFKFLSRQKLSYVITSKGENSSNRINLNVFKPHLALVAISALALVASLFNGNDSAVMRFWALHNTVILSLVAGSEHIVKFYGTLKSFTLTSPNKATVKLNP